MFLSDVSKISMFPRRNPSTQRSRDDCFLCAENRSSHGGKTKHELRNCLSYPKRCVAKGFCFSALDAPIPTSSYLMGRIFHLHRKFELCPPLPLLWAGTTFPNFYLRIGKEGSVNEAFPFPGLRMKPVCGFKKPCFYFPPGKSQEAAAALGWWKQKEMIQRNPWSLFLSQNDKGF